MSEYCEPILAEAKKCVGRESSVRWGRYPVEREPIRRWCHMANNLNPLYLNEEYALKTKWKGIICPPLMVSIFADTGSPPSASGPEIDWPPPNYDLEENIMPPTAGNKAINLGGGWVFHKVVRLGDRLGYKRRLTDVYIKTMRYDPEAFWVATETIYVNQKLETVAVNTNLLIKHRDPEQIKATTPEQLAQIKA